MADGLINGLGGAPQQPQLVRTMVNTPAGIRVIYATNAGQFVAEITIFSMEQSVIPELLQECAGAFKTAIVRAPAGLADKFRG